METGRSLPRPIAVLSTLLLLAAGARTQGYEIWEASGTGDGAHFGASAAPMGDLDGDGLLDLVVGAFGGGPGGIQVRALSGASGLALYVANGIFLAGPSIASVGDLSGDGVPDFAVPSGPLPIVAREFSGANGAPLTTLNVPTGTYESPYSVAGVGDVNLDGVPDVIVGFPYLPFGESRAGVFSGATGAVLFTVSSSSGYGEQLGWSVAGIGDVNGDGQADLVVGAPQAVAPAPGFQQGRVTAFSGANGSVLFNLYGTGAGEFFGYSIAALADLSGDGVPDLVVGAPPSSYGPPGPGRAVVFSGANGLPLFEVVGSNGLEGFGRNVAAAGDVNGDGLSDFAVSVPNALGTGPIPVGNVRVHSGNGGGLLFTLVGEPGYAGFGASLAGGADATGDGIPDLLVGTPNSDSGGWIDSGTAGLYSVAGIPTGSSPFGAGCPGSGGEVPVLATAEGEPSATAGNPAFQVVLSNALGGSSGLLLAGLSLTNWWGLPLPFDLALLGMPGCLLLVSPDFVFPATTSGSGALEGRVFLPMPIPPAPSLAGATVHFQWYVVDPGPAPVPGAVSPGLSLLLF